MSSNPSAYRGEEPYTFACYAHADSETVYSLIRALQKSGNNIWYDEGISPGSSWTEELAAAIEASDRFIFFVSPQSVASNYCLDEINFALEHRVEVITVYLEETELPAGLRLSLNRRQAILKMGLNHDSFVRKIDSALKNPVRIEPVLNDAVTKRVPKRWLVAGVISIALLIALVAMFQSLRHPADSEPSVLLLPFEDLGLVDSLSYLPASLNNDLIGRLSRSPNLKVIAPLSAQKFAISGKSPEEMAITSGVEHVLIGSMQSAGDVILVSASLTNLKDHRIVWSDQFSGSIENLFELQAEFSASIARALSLQLNDKLLEQMRTSGTSSIEAFELMLRNLDLVRTRTAQTPQEVLANLQRAVKLDPKFVNAWASLAIVTEINRFLNAEEGDALAYAETAYRLDPENPRALRAMGFVRMTSDPELALEYLEKAVAVMPQNSQMHTDKGIALISLGRHEEAYGVLQRAIELDPLNEFARTNLVDALTALGRMEEARAEAEHGVALQPNNPHARIALSQLLAQSVDPFESFVEMVRALEGNPMLRAELGLILRLIQYDQLDAASAWQTFFMARNSNQSMGFMSGRIAKSSGDVTKFKSWLSRLPADFERNQMLKLNAMTDMMQANVTSEADDRLSLHKQAWTAFAESEALQPIGASPISDLVLFAVLERELGSPEKMPELLQRTQTIAEIDLFATERALSLILMAEEDAALSAIEDLAQRGLLNIPLLQELGMLGHNSSLFGTFVEHPRFDQAVIQQELTNEKLRSQASAEFPKLLNPKP